MENKKEDKNMDNIVTAFDRELDSSYELPHGWKYSKMLKLFERELYYSRMANWCDNALKNQKLPDSLVEIILENEDDK